MAGPQLQGLLEYQQTAGQLRIPQDSEVSRLIREQMELADETQRLQEQGGQGQNLSLEEILAAPAGADGAAG